jgi:hypothetical protein
MYLILAVSVTLNIYQALKVARMGRLIFGMDDVFQAVAEGEAVVSKKPNGRWTIERSR